MYKYRVIVNGKATAWADWFHTPLAELLAAARLASAA